MANADFLLGLAGAGAQQQCRRQGYGRRDPHSASRLTGHVQPRPPCPRSGAAKSIQHWWISLDGVAVAPEIVRIDPARRGALVAVPPARLSEHAAPRRFRPRRIAPVGDSAANGRLSPSRHQPPSSSPSPATSACRDTHRPARAAPAGTACPARRPERSRRKCSMKRAAGSGRQAAPRSRGRSAGRRAGAAPRATAAPVRSSAHGRSTPPG